MKYTIAIDYTASDSFESHRETDEVPVVWANQDTAVEALRRIRDLYLLEWRINKDTFYGKTNDINVKAVERASGAGEFASFSMMLPLDDGTDQPIDSFWRGWGKTLHSAKIVLVDNFDNETCFAPEKLSAEFLRAAANEKDWS